MASNYSDGKSPRPGVVGPLPNGHGLHYWGDPNHLRYLGGIILHAFEAWFRKPGSLQKPAFSTKSGWIFMESPESLPKMAEMGG